MARGVGIKNRSEQESVTVDAGFWGELKVVWTTLTARPRSRRSSASWSIGAMRLRNRNGNIDAAAASSGGAVNERERRGRAP
uniref:Uncharacterized protein n=1 Tax=Oryza barthii TaxID=65489 RepID=A0A0D3G4Z4_9ORYZ